MESNNKLNEVIKVQSLIENKSMLDIRRNRRSRNLSNTEEQLRVNEAVFHS